MAKVAANDATAAPPGTPAWTDNDRAALSAAAQARADGVALLDWWRRTHAAGAYAKTFELIRTFNTPEESFAFFDDARLPDRAVPVMGLVEDMLYDQPKTSPAEKVRDELREFVLHYFLRVSAFERPEAYADPDNRPPRRALESLSWCPRYQARQTGFGYTQLYYKRRDTGEVGAFPEDRQARIVDLREIGTTYEWVILKVRIYDFNFVVRPRGQESAQLVVPLKEESYLVLSPEFVVAEDDPEPGVLGRYGFGYAFVKDPFVDGPLGYGPGQFGVSFQLVHFRVLDTGRVQLDLVFVANRPERVLNLTVEPVEWGLRLADLFTFGAASRALGPARRWLARLGPRIPGVDPVRGLVSLANALTGGAAARDYCVSWEQLEKQFLVQHFMQHYQMITGSLLTWRQHPSWIDRPTLPDEIVRGVKT